jgi:glycosyltransferase involved in cell wall biosynthesis
VKFSVIIPNYNSGKYLEKTLDSVFSQSYRDFEVVVVDGYSTDNSSGILDKYQKREPDNMRVIRTVIGGAVEHINLGMDRSRGDIVSWLCADDTYEPGCLETVAKYFERGSTQWVYGKVKIVDTDGNETRQIVTRAKEVLQSRYSYAALQCVCFISEPSVFMRKEFYQGIGEYDRLPLVADYDYWLRAGRVSSPVFVKDRKSVV